MGKLVKYDNQIILIGGGWTALVEQLNAKQTQWENHTMSPVNDLNELEGFTAFSLKKSLFIFGMLSLVK